jgi:hypothetical protein
MKVSGQTRCSKGLRSKGSSSLRISLGLSIFRSYTTRNTRALGWEMPFGQLSQYKDSTSVGTFPAAHIIDEGRNCGETAQANLNETPDSDRQMWLAFFGVQTMTMDCRKQLYGAMCRGISRYCAVGWRVRCLSLCLASVHGDSTRSMETC